MDQFPTFWAMYPGAVESFALKLRNAISAEIERVKAGVTAAPARTANEPTFVGRTAVVDISGPIFKRAGVWSRYGFSGSAEIADTFRALRTDRAIDNVLAFVDSPGGDVDGLIYAADEIGSTNAVKPVTVQSRGMIASAAFWLSANASAIYAGPLDLVGSIGVRTALVDVSRLYANAGVEMIPIDTGPHKSAGLPGTPVTDAHKAEVQKIVDGYMSAFLATIRTGRGDRISADALKQASDGRVFFPEEAQRLGLIDGIQAPAHALAQLTPNTQRRTGSARARLSLIPD